MHVALAQLNPLVGDLQGNADRILAAVREAEAQAADLVLTPELSLWGYPPRDLLLQPARIAQQQGILQQLVNQLTSSITLLVGVALATDDNRAPALQNGIVLVNRLGWRPVACKQLLPSYDVFDERRGVHGVDDARRGARRVEDRGLLRVWREEQVRRHVRGDGHGR